MVKQRDMVPTRLAGKRVIQRKLVTTVMHGRHYHSTWQKEVQIDFCFLFLVLEVEMLKVFFLPSLSKEPFPTKLLFPAFSG